MRSKLEQVQVQFEFVFDPYRIGLLSAINCFCKLKCHRDFRSKAWSFDTIEMQDLNSYKIRRKARMFREKMKNNN